MNVSAAVVPKVLKGRWEHWRWGAQWLAIRSWQQPIQSHLEADSLKLHEKLLKNSTSTILQSSTFEANWKGEKPWQGSASRHEQAAPKKKKNCHFEVLSSLSLHSNNKPFLKRIVTWNEKLIVYNNQQWPAQWLDWEKAPKPTCTKIKVMITVWWSAAGLIHYSFGETITSEKYAQQIDEMHQKLKCLLLALVNRKGPALLHDNART